AAAAFRSSPPASHRRSSKLIFGPKPPHTQTVSRPKGFRILRATDHVRRRQSPCKLQAGCHVDCESHGLSARKSPVRGVFSVARLLRFIPEAQGCASSPHASSPHACGRGCPKSPPTEIQPCCGDRHVQVRQNVASGSLERKPVPKYACAFRRGTSASPDGRAQRIEFALCHIALPARR